MLHKFIWLLAMALLPTSLIADDLIAYDGFSGNSVGWSSDWYDGDDSNTFELSVRDLELTYEDDCGIQIWGGDTCMKATSTRSGDQSKFISRDVEGLKETFYVSCLVQFSPEPWNKWWYPFTSWNYFAIGKKDDVDDSGILMGTAYTAWKLGAAFCQNGSKRKYVDIIGSQQPTLNKTYMIVGKWECNSSGVITNITLWINPNSLTSESAEYTVSTSYSPDDEMTSIDLQSCFGGTTYMDEIRVGRTWESVVSSITPTNYYYSGGTGTEDDPFIIANKYDLLDLTTNSDDWDKCFLQTANIIFDADSSQEDWNWDGDVDSDDESGFSPIGTENVNFTGTYDGQGYRIKNLFLDRSSNGVGLFGYCSGATIKNVQLSKVKIYGTWTVGAIAGSCNDECNIENCLSTGRVEGRGPIGGLVGAVAASTISQSYSMCDVEGQYQVGGLIGMLQGSSSLVQNCFSGGNAGNTYSVGGLIGQQKGGDIENSYSMGRVSGSEYGYGGLIGEYSKGNVENSYWDVEASASSVSGAGVGKTKDEMKSESTFSGWDFSSVWTFNEKYNNGYPYLKELEKSFAMQLTEFVGDGAWSDQDDWTNGVPDDETALAIISGSCEVDDNVVVPAIEVSSSGELIISESADVVSLITLESDNAGRAEYINKNTVETTYDTVIQERYFEGGQWNFICVPTNITADDLFPDLQLASSWSDSNGEYWITEYSQEQRATEGSGMVDIYDGNYVLETGKGYMVWVDESQVGKYKFLVDNASKQIDAPYTDGESDANNGWNLMGNCYTHTLTYDDLFGCENNTEYFTGAVYLWDGEGYKTWTGTTGDAEAREIKPMEAFFVKRTSSDDSNVFFCLSGTGCDCAVSANKSAVVTSANTSGNNIGKIYVGVSPENGYCSDYAYINVSNLSGLVERSAIKYEKRSSSKDIIYSVMNNNALAVNFFYLEKNTDIAIPIVVNLSSDKDAVTLSYGIDNDDEFSFYLVDKVNSDTVPLSKFGELTYSLNTESHISGRFELLVKSVYDVCTKVPDNVEGEESFISLMQEDEALRLTSLVDTQLDFAIYDMMGRRIVDMSLSPSEDCQLSIASGVYIIRCRAGNVVHSQKFIVK